MIDVPNPVQLAAELTIAWLSNANSRVRSEDVQAFLRSSYDAVVDLTSIAKKVERIEIDLKQFIPAVSVRKSLASKDYILSLIDGRP